MNNIIHTAVIPHPFSTERVCRDIAAGDSIEDILVRLQSDAVLRRHAHVYLNDDYIPQDQWPRLYPKAGTHLTVRFVPMGGGGGKNPLRTVLSLATLAISPVISASLTGALGIGAQASFLGISVGRLVSTGVSMVSRLALNALAPPARSRFSGNKESTTLFLQGARNQTAPFSRVPKVLGKHRFVPPLGAPAYTETIGNDQYLRMLFVWGYGPLEISDLKIGETPLSDFTDVEIETRQGYNSDAPITLYSNSVLQNDLQILLKNSGGYISRTSDTDADEISVDVTFHRGLFLLGSSGNKKIASVDIEVQYSPAGANSWVTAETLSVTAKQSTALRKSVRFQVTRGRYDVRLKRLTADSTNDDLFDEVIWTALRTIRYTQPIAMPGIAMTAVRIKATDQLNGVIDRFNGVVHSILPDWNGSTWVERVTSNPAALYRHVLQGNANARPLADARLDLDKIQAWHNTCDAAGHEFNAVIDYDISVREVLQNVASAGRASPSLIDGKWAVMIDTPQTVPIQHFTPRNTYNFRGEKSFDDTPHALRVRFINRDKDWLQDERLVFDDGYTQSTATKYDTLELNGITDADTAWKHGRYHIATARLRPETYSFYADIEHIVATRGDLIRFSHDVPLFGLMSARVKSVSISGSNITGVTLDAAVTMEAGKTYAIRFRLSDGATLVKTLVTNAGTHTVVLFATPNTSGPALGDLALFGESGQESVELIIRTIEPQNDLAAKITCVDAAPAIHTADTGTIPAFSSQISTPPELQRPPAPILSEIQSGSESLIRGADGSVTNRILVTLAPPSFSMPLTATVMIRAAGETGFHPATLLSATQTSLSIADIENGETYDLQIRYVSAAGAISAPLIITGHRVDGSNTQPEDVTGFSLNMLGDTAHLIWSPVADIDLSHYVLRYTPATSGATWNAAVDIVSHISREAASTTVPAALGSYLIKAVNFSGQMSQNAAVIVSSVTDLSGYNAVLTLTEDPSFAGVKTGVGISGSGLQLEGADSIDDWSNIDTLANTDIGENGIVLTGQYDFDNAVDLGAVYTSRLTASMAVAANDLSNSMDVWADIDAVESFDQSLDPSLWSVQLQLRTTPDDPSGAPVWSNWLPFVVGDYTARAFEFRTLLVSYDDHVTPVVSALSVDVDMPDRTTSGQSISSDAGGSTISFTPAFRATPAVAITPYNLATGDYYTLTALSAASFDIRFFNSAGTGVSRNFDYIAKGYGYVG